MPTRTAAETHKKWLQLYKSLPSSMFWCPTGSNHWPALEGIKCSLQHCWQAAVFLSCLCPNSSRRPKAFRNFKNTWSQATNETKSIKLPGINKKAFRQLSDHTKLKNIQFQPVRHVPASTLLSSCNGRVCKDVVYTCSTSASSCFSWSIY